MSKSKDCNERLSVISRINKFLAMLLLLNAADGFLTYVGVQSGYAIEVNAIMVPVVTNPVKLFLFKILLPSVLMGLLSFITQKTKDKSLVRIERFIHALVWIYLGVLFLHAVWIWFAVYSIFR